MTDSDKNRSELAAAGLGLVLIGAGSGFALLPKLIGRLFGMKEVVAEQSSTQLVVRTLGFRDIAFGLGLLNSRTRPESARQWLKLFSLCMAGDVVACGLALRKPGSSPVVALGGLASVVFGIIAWLAGQDKEK